MSTDTYCEGCGDDVYCLPCLACDTCDEPCTCASDADDSDLAYEGWDGGY